jgi:hypothetical protein
MVPTKDGRRVYCRAVDEALSTGGADGNYSTVVAYDIVDQSPSDARAASIPVPDGTTELDQGRARVANLRTGTTAGTHQFEGIRQPAIGLTGGDSLNLPPTRLTIISTDPSNEAITVRNDTNPSAGNQFARIFTLTGEDVELRPGQWMEFVYAAGSWRQVGGSVGGLSDQETSGSVASSGGTLVLSSLSDVPTDSYHEYEVVVDLRQGTLRDYYRAVVIAQDVGGTLTVARVDVTSPFANGVFVVSYPTSGAQVQPTLTNNSGTLVDSARILVATEERAHP